MDCIAFGATNDASFSGIGGCMKMTFDFVKYEIFMNIFQQVGLWFTKMGFPQLFDECFHKIMDFVSFIWAIVMSITPLQIFYIWASITTVLIIIWLIQKIWDPAPKKSVTGTISWSERGTIWNLWTRGLVTILTTLYLPCITSTFRVIFCYKDLMEPYELVCYQGKHWLHFGFAVFILFFVGIFFPYHLYLVIDKYQPKPHAYDESGVLLDVESDRETLLFQYRDLLKRDKCPYNFLYAGYEYGWSFYKVVTIVMKMILIIPMIPFFHENIVATSVSLAIVVIYAVMSSIWTPFILPEDDWIDLAARACAVGTMVCQLLYQLEIIYDPWSGYIMTSFTIINYGTMVLLTISTMDFVRNFWRARFGRLKFQNDMHYDLTRGRKQRIWQRFWRGMFKTYGSLATVGDRLAEMEDIVTEYGIAEYKKGLVAPSPEVAQARKMALELEGVDVYFQGNVHQPTYWGRLVIEPFPFKAFLIYDETEYVERLCDEELLELERQNCRQPRTLEARKFRQALRCLDGEYVNARVTATVPVGSGLSKEECEVRFEYGLLRVRTNTNDMMHQGFKVTVEFEDGVATLSDGTPVEGIKYTAGHYDLGITPDFFGTPMLLSILNDPANHALIESKWDELQERLRMYQEDLEEQRREGDEIVSYNFWFVVFNNDHMPRDELENYILNFEQNPALHEMIELYREDIDSLYEHLDYYDSHPSTATWYCFWDDIALYNGVINEVAAHPELFDMSRDSALAYSKISLEEAKAMLKKAGLRKRGGRGLFNDRVFSNFEEALANAGTETAPAEKQHRTTPTALLTDTRCISTRLTIQNVQYLTAAATLAW